MDNLILFINAFLSYFLVFIVIIVLVTAAVFFGIRLRKAKDAKHALAKELSGAPDEEQ